MTRTDPLILKDGKILLPLYSDGFNFGPIASSEDDGDKPTRILISHSGGGGYSWSYARKSDIPNPGASIEILKLKSGRWLLIYNDVDDGRYSLAAAISEDEGKSWKCKKNLENTKDASFSYPSVIQGRDGIIHLTYSYHLPEKRKSIKHVSFKEKWVME